MVKTLEHLIHASNMREDAERKWRISFLDRSKDVRHTVSADG